MAAVRALAHAIASAFLDGPWIPREMAERATRAVRGIRTETRIGIDGRPIGPSALAGHVAHACTLVNEARARKLRAMLARLP